MNIYYDKDADLSLIQNMNVVVVGYGSQGHAHANNLRDSGVSVTVGLRAGSGSWRKAENASFDVAEVANAVKDADVVMILVPDELAPALYRDHLEANMKEGAALAFAHGFNVHFELIEPRADLDVIMIAPKGPGHTVRSTYVAGGGVPSLIAVAQDATGQAKDIALSYASANGGGRAGIIERAPGRPSIDRGPAAPRSGGAPGSARSVGRSGAPSDAAPGSRWSSDPCP